MEIRPDRWNEAQFLPGSGRVDTAVWMHYMDANQTAREETWRQLHKNVESNIEQVLATTPHETPTVRPPASHHENYTGQTSQTEPEPDRARQSQSQIEWWHLIRVLSMG